MHHDFSLSRYYYEDIFIINKYIYYIRLHSASFGMVLLITCSFHTIWEIYVQTDAELDKYMYGRVIPRTCLFLRAIIQIVPALWMLGYTGCWQVEGHHVLQIRARPDIRIKYIFQVNCWGKVVMATCHLRLLCVLKIYLAVQLDVTIHVRSWLWQALFRWRHSSMVEEGADVERCSMNARKRFENA